MKETDKTSSAEDHCRRAQGYRAGNRLDEAVASYRRALEIQPDFVPALTGLGKVFFDAGRFAESESCLGRAREITPDDPSIHDTLGFVLMYQLKLSEAIACFSRALELDPEFYYSLCNLAGILVWLGNIPEAVHFYRKAIQLKPDTPLYFSNLLLTMHYSEQFPADEICALHRAWADRYEPPLQKDLQPYLNDRSPDRKIRIGYVSPDFRNHAVAYFFEPLLASHDRSGFEIFCYASVARRDAVTERLRSTAAAWRDISRATDEEAAAMVRSDRIDILVDLAGHTADNRLLVFARRPAPVQATWLGYPDTTGLEAMDYRVTDHWADPPGLTEHLHSEELVRLARGFLCYQPPANIAEPTVPPSSAKGHVTFGSFNHRAKITPEMVKVWAEILAAVPGSRMIFKFPGPSDQLTRRLLLDLFFREQIPADRIEFFAYTMTREAHFELYNLIDITLDTFPYHGTTTTFESLWMGVPVITLSGRTHVSRVGCSILSGAGLAECIAGSKNEYRDKAVALAANPEKRASLRTNLRFQLMASPLMDAKDFARSLEQEYRTMWKKWCGSGPRRSDSLMKLVLDGENLFNAGDLDGAIRKFLEARIIAPDNLQMLNDLAVACWHAGNKNKAVELLARALEIDPGNPDAAANMLEIKRVGQNP